MRRLYKVRAKDGLTVEGAVELNRARLAKKLKLIIPGIWVPPTKEQIEETEMIRVFDKWLGIKL